MHRSCVAPGNVIQVCTTLVVFIECSPTEGLSIMNTYERFRSGARCLLLASMVLTARIATQAQEVQVGAPGSGAVSIVNGTIPMSWSVSSGMNGHGKVALWDGETGRCWTLADSVDLRQKTFAIPAADLLRSTKLRVLIRQEDRASISSGFVGKAGTDIASHGSSSIAIDSSTGISSSVMSKIDVRRRGRCVDYGPVPELAASPEMTFDCQDLGGRTLKDVDYTFHDGIVTVCDLPVDTYVVIRIGTKDGRMLRSEVILQDERSLLQRSTLTSPR